MTTKEKRLVDNEKVEIRISKVANMVYSPFHSTWLFLVSLIRTIAKG